MRFTKRVHKNGYNVPQKVAYVFRCGTLESADKFIAEIKEEFHPSVGHAYLSVPREISNGEVTVIFGQTIVLDHEEILERFEAYVTARRY